MNKFLDFFVKRVRICTLRKYEKKKIMEKGCKFS